MGAAAGRGACWQRWEEGSVAAGGGGVFAEGGVMPSGSIDNELGLMSAMAWAFGSFAVVGDTEES